MPAQVQDITTVHFALSGLSLLKDREEFEAFRSAIAVDVAITQGFTPVAGGGGQPQRSLSLPKERITLTFTPNSTTITREYPVDTGDLKRLAEVAQLAIDNSDVGNQQPRLFGFVVDLIFDQDTSVPASLYLANILFAPTYSLFDEGWDLKGGEGTLEYVRETRRRLITMESQTDDDASTRVYMRFGEHVTEERIPEQGEILASLVDAWKRAAGFVDSLDKRK